MDDLQKFTTIFERFIKAHSNIDPVHGSVESVAEYGNHFEWFCNQYPEGSPMRHFVEDCLFAFMNYLEEKNGVSRDDILATHYRHLQSITRH